MEHPRISGHESAGEVVELGEKLGLEIGMRARGWGKLLGARVMINQLPVF